MFQTYLLFMVMTQLQPKLQPKVKPEPLKDCIESLAFKSLGLSGTTFYSPFTSSFNSATAPTSTYTLQGIKTNPYGSRGNKTSYIITGTTGSPFKANVAGAV